MFMDWKKQNIAQYPHPEHPQLHLHKHCEDPFTCSESKTFADEKRVKALLKTHSNERPLNVRRFLWEQPQTRTGKSPFEQPDGDKTILTYCLKLHIQTEKS